MRRKYDWYGASIFGVVASMIYVLFLVMGTSSKPLNNIASQGWAWVNHAKIGAEHKKEPGDAHPDLLHVGGASSQATNR